MEFLDRVDERRRLERFLALEEGALACVYGRRRIGKSRLLAEVFGSGKANAVTYCADRSEAPLQRARMADDLSRLIPGFGDVEYRDWRSFFDRWRSDAPRGSVMVLDEFPYLAEASRELPSVLQHIADGLRESGQKMILCGSSQRMMQGLVLGREEPLYGRCRLVMKLGPIGFEWTERAFPGLDGMRRLANYAVWGGVPRYWEVASGGELEDVLREEVFSDNGLFREEPAFLLRDELEGAAQAASVLALIGQGTERPSEMAGRLQVPQTALGRPLRRLLDLGLVRRETPFGRDGRESKRAHYKLEDPFLRFWYRFVLPRYSDSGYLSGKGDRETFGRAFRTFMGMAWEDLAREMTVRNGAGPDGMRWVNAGRWWGTGLNRKPMELDVVAESEDGRTLFAGEAKLAQSGDELRRTQRELEVKAGLLPFAGKYERVVCKVLVAERMVEGEEFASRR